uniref:Myb-like domain-containing protein n=1 Tax=Kalanchoe fedtschenkoi TaxID=63787 RepID=A0A7N0U6N2_KALFE
MPPKKKEESASRRTRSQVAPGWTLTDSLTLVNEIAAVEAECLDALSYYQKWKIISDNCAALEVNRTLDQCRRKWDSLFAEYDRIKRWEGGGDAYWGLARERRRAVGLPEDFDRDLFNAVDVVVKAQVERASSRPDAVLEDADADPLGVISPPVFKKQSHQLTPQKRQVEVKKEKKIADDRQTGSADVMATQPGEKDGSVEVTASQLREKAELIQAILEGKLAENKDYTLGDLKQGPSSRINLARRQGDKLIDCFGLIASTLDQLCKATHTQ